METIIPGKYNTWMDNFITEKDNCYITWDETQAYDLGKFSTHEEAVQALITHSIELNQE